MSLISQNKSLKLFGLHQLFGNQYNLNFSDSNFNGSGFKNCKALFYSNKPVELYHDLKKKNFSPKNKKDTINKEDQSLVKSKQFLQKITNKLTLIPSKNYENSSIQLVKKGLYETTKEISNQIDNKIENQFHKILNNHTIMPLNNGLNDPSSFQGFYEKQNCVPNALSYFEGTNTLMTEYWSKQKQKKVETLGKQTKTEKSLPISQFLPNLLKNQKLKQNITLKVISQKPKRKVKTQKNRKQILKQKEQSLKTQFTTFSVTIINYQIQNQSNQFLIFQRLNFKKWGDILFVLKCLQKFCVTYQIISAKIDLKKVLQLVDLSDKRQILNEAFTLQKLTRSSLKDFRNAYSLNQFTKKQFTPHELLNCFQDAEKISENHPYSKGIRYFGNKGKKRAIIKIQSNFRRFLTKKKFQQQIKILFKVRFIQRKFRSYLEYSHTKKKIFNLQLEKLERFKLIQQQFQQNYRKYQLTKKVKYEIHICSIGSTEWRRVTTENLNQKQNTELSRIFRIGTKSTPLIETRVIYITPNQLSKQIVNYYKKILEFGSENNSEKINISNRVTILWPDKIEKLPESLTLAQKLFYSRSTIKRLKNILKGNYSYIVPSNPSNDFINLSYELGVPLYSADPQKLLYLQTKSGTKSLTSELKSLKEDESFGVLPYTKNIYNKASLVKELGLLILNYPSVQRWILKIDNEYHSRGLAYIDTSKIIKSQLLSKLLDPIRCKEHGLKQKLQEKLNESLIRMKQQRIIPLSSQVYRSQEEYLQHFLAYGGIIEASINNFQADLENHCFAIEIQPDFEWKFLTSYYKITNKNKTVGCYFDSDNQIQPPFQIQKLVKELINRKLFGFFTLEFLKIKTKTIKNQQISSTQLSFNQENLTYFNGIQCHLNQLSSASFLKDFLSRDSNALYIPFLPHLSLKELRIQAFFHFCRLQNISFDIKRKIGNIFMFLNGLESGCMGLMSFNGLSKQQTFQQVSDVLELLSSKINYSKKQQKITPDIFTAARNVVNGYLKRQRDERLSRTIKQAYNSKKISRSISSKQLV